MTGSGAIELIGRLGWSKAEAARLLGISTTAVQKWTTGGELHGSTATLLGLLAARPELADVVRREWPERWR